MKLNAVSQDFPLKTSFSNVSPYKTIQKAGIKIFKDIKNGFNNEIPEFFRLDSMKENPSYYKNPFLDEVIKEDRSDFLKSYEKNRDQLKLIEKIKSRREYSQDSKILKFIQSSTDLEIARKRDMIKQERNKSTKSLIPCLRLSADEDPQKYMKKLKTLNDNYTPKIQFPIKNQLTFDYMNTVNPSVNYKCNSEDMNSLKILQTSFDPKKSSYLRNMSDNPIQEIKEQTEQSVLHFKKKNVSNYNCLNDTYKEFTQVPFTNRKWTKFNEK